MACGTSTVSQNSVPQWVTDAGKDIYGKAKTFYESGYQPYTGDRVAGFTPAQTQAFNAVTAYQPADVTGEALNMVRAGSAPVSTERVVDEGGRLGAISDYLNPYRENALNPAIDQIVKSANAQRKSLGGQAIAANAFGDARHGILESDLNLNENKAIGDTAATFLNNAFNEAMGQRQTDLSRFMSADQLNRANQFAGAQGLTSTAAAGQDAFTKQMQALLGVGTAQQQQSQNVLDTNYEAYQAKQQDAYDRLASLVSVIQGLPYNRTQTTTKDDGLGGIFGLLGSLAGGIFGG